MTQLSTIRFASRLGRSLSIGVLSAALASAAVGDGNAQDAAADGKLIARGREIVAGRCARCHSIDATSDSPQRGVIAFRDFHRHYPIAMIMEAKSSGVISGHDEMPMTALGREDVDAMLAFIDSLSPPGGPRYLKK